MRGRLFPLLSCLLFAGPLLSQDTDLTGVPEEDSVRVRTLVEMAGEQLLDRPDSAEALCRLALRVAERAGEPESIAEVEGWLAYLTEQRGALDEAIAHNERSLSLLRQLGNKKNEATVLNNLGAIYKDLGRLDEALAAHRRSLAIRMEAKDTVGMATSLNNLGLIAYDQGRIPEALQNYMEALRMYGKGRDAAGIATVMHNIAGIYKDQGDHAHALAYLQRALRLNELQNDVYATASTEDNIGGVLREQGHTDDALQHYRRALSLHASVDDARGMGYSLSRIAGLELDRGTLDTALVHARQSLAHFEASSDKRGRATALWTMGSVLERMGRTSEALTHGREALALARELGYPQQLRDAAALLGRLFRAQQQWRPALEMQDLYMAMRDSIRSEDARRSTMRQQFQYAFEKRETELKGLAREQVQKEKNRRNLGLAGGTGVLLIAAGLWMRLRHTRRSREAIRKEKDISEGLLLNILPAGVAEELKRKGHAEARHYDQATILFTDFKGFTSIAEQLSPADLVAEINTCFKAFDLIIDEHRVEKIKTIGDAYMAVGGVPDPNVGRPEDVVAAALAMQAFMHERALQREREKRPAFRMRVGIHSGPVVAGIVGVKKFQYDIWGDAVNVASRMESSGEVGQVNISEATYALVKDASIPPGTGPAFTFTPRGKVQAKGKGEMEMYFISSAAGPGSRSATGEP